MIVKKQKEIAKLLFEGRTTQAEIMSQYQLNDKKFTKLTRSATFKEEVAHLGEMATHETFMILSRYGPIAAKTLVALLESEKPDVARRAALDIINHNLEVKGQSDDPGDGDPHTLSESEAWRQIRALANQSGGGGVRP